MKLQRVSLYRNQLGFFERQAPVAEALHAGDERLFAIRVPHARKQMVVDTLSCSTPQGVPTVKHGGEQQNQQQQEESYYFSLDSESGLGGFLASCKGAEVRVEVEGGRVIEGKILMLERETEVISGTEKTQQVWGSIYILGSSIQKLKMKEVITLTLALTATLTLTLILTPRS